MPLTTENIFLHLLKACFSRETQERTRQHSHELTASSMMGSQPAPKQAPPPQPVSSSTQTCIGWKTLARPFQGNTFPIHCSAFLKAKLDFVGLMWVNFGNRGGEKLLNINLKCKILGALLFDFHLYIRPVVQYQYLGRRCIADFSCLTFKGTRKKTSRKLRNCPNSRYSKYSRIVKFGRSCEIWSVFSSL